MATVGDFDQTKALFLAPIVSCTNTCYYSIRPDFIHHPGCVIIRKISLNMVKWVSHGPCLRQRSNNFFEFLLF